MGRSGSIRLVRGVDGRRMLTKALDHLQIKQGESFVVMAASHRDELNRRAEGLREERTA